MAPEPRVPERRADPCCRRSGLRARAGWALIAALALAVVPKCPLCLAAYLSVLGLGTGVAAALAVALRPAALVVSLAVVIVLVRRRVRRAALR